jgi:hypothetical protein
MSNNNLFTMNNSSPETDSPMYENYSLSDMMELDALLPLDHQDFEMELQAVQQEQRRASRGSSKNVSFDEYLKIELIERISEMTEGEKSDSWYHRSERDDFRNQARKLCKTDSKGQESTRGLECYSRQRRRRLQRTNDQVLRAYLFAGDSEQVGVWAEEYNAEARQFALATAVQDYYEAYFPHIIHQSSTPDAFEPTPLCQLACVGQSTLERRF